MGQRQVEGAPGDREAMGRRAVRILTVAYLAVGLSSAAGAAPADRCASGSIGDGVPISPIGAFSDMRTTEEHAYGYTVMMWRAGDCMIGFLSVAEGLAGDSPIGMLEDLSVDARNGVLTFTAKLTTGITTVPGGKDLVPSRDLFAFKGRMKDRAITGTIERSMQDGRGVAPTRETISLAFSPEQSELMHGPTSYGEWRRQWEPILRRRGPQWH